MCGIVGLVEFGRALIDPNVVGQMTATLAHRGPEACGIQYRSAGAMQVGLGHARLKIVDLSEAADQPMASDDERIWVVFNGEIYNFRQLRKWLEQQGCRFRTTSDTEVLLRLYETAGEACVSRLEGMFAFAIWDERQQRLLLARDRLGKKPLFYYADSARFAFASELKALLRHPAITPSVHTDVLPVFFVSGYVPTPQTLYAGIQKLPPGHCLRLEPGGAITLDEYWDVPLDGPSAPATGAASADQWIPELRDRVVDAVQARLIADVPIGAFLSGGLDSSVIVGVMSQLSQEPVRTFSIGFVEDADFDETRYARLAAKRFQTRHTEFRVEPSAVELVERLVWHYDGPFSDSSAIPTYLLAQLARQHVTVALTGDGGDELFAGYLRFYATLLAERVPGWMRRATHGALTGVPPWGHHRNILRRTQKLTGSMALPFQERFNRWISVFYEDLPELLPQSGRELQQASSVLQAWQEPYLQRAANVSDLTRLLYLNLKTYLLDDLLVKMDRCSMAHALEARSPFLDRALLEYVFGLPDQVKLRWGQTKWILRRAFADLIPTPILRRGKMGFGIPLQRWFRNDLRDFLQDLLAAPDARLKTYVNQEYVRRILRAHVAGEADHSERLWTLLTFEVWLRNLALETTRASAPALSAVGELS